MINRIVNAKTDNPKLKTLLRISRYFGISITELVEANMDSEAVTAEQPASEVVAA